MDAARVCSYAVADDAWLAALHACEAVDVADEYCPRCELLRDVFGNPFHPVALDPDWRTAPAVSLARRMYDAHDFGGMPDLADALQDGGCENERILDHCRYSSPLGVVHGGPPAAGRASRTSPHVRGCWVVDLVLGKA